MRKIYFKYDTGYCGTDRAEVVKYEDSVTDEELDQDAWNGAVSNAEMYGYYPEEWLEDMSDQDLEELEESGVIDNYTYGIEGTWEEYDPKKHDGTF